MTTPIFKKVGRRYVEIGVYDNEAMYYPHGTHIVISGSGSTLTKYSIEPAHAAVESALQRVRDVMAKAMHKATEMTPTKRPYSKKEMAGIKAYTEIAGNPIALRFEGASMSDVIEAGIKLLKAEALK